MILSLESSTSVCSIALHQEKKLLGTKFISDPRKASAELLVEAKNLLVKNSINPSELIAIAISSGPGSYTGLRISSSAAKGLCYSLSIPLIPVNSLLVMAYPIIQSHESDLFCPMIDARRMEVYYTLFRSDLSIVKEMEAKILESDCFLEELNQNRITFFGDGSKKFKAIANHPNAIFVEGVQPQARNLGVLAYEKLLKNDFENTEQFEPLYLKDFIVKKKVPKPDTTK
jgi:tRNA threonylcarbamoyladenosine biosynthesis protein TsaB